MNRTEIDAAFAAANPLSDRQALSLSLSGAEAELLEYVVEIPVRPRPQPAPPAARRHRMALVLAVVAVAAVALALLPSGRQDGGPSPAFAASLVRFANASPLALLRLPSWHVVYADEAPGGFGEMHFVRGRADADGTPHGASFRATRSLAGRVASLTWSPANRVSRTYIAAGRQTVPTGLGVTAPRLVGEASGHGWLDVSAVFIYGGRVLSFRATVTDMAAFRAELQALNAVDTATWLGAMPPSVVKAADSSETIRLMLRGIPLPPRFDAARIRGARLVRDHYQLGAAVTGTVACMWIADWNHARATGDATMVRRATAAMATAPHWPILREMARQGGWSQAVIGYARAMPRGTWYGRPLAADVNSGLGCTELGVRLGP